MIKFTDLWNTKGTLDRGDYALVGFVGVAVR